MRRLLSLSAALALAGTAWAADRYVETIGDDAANDCTTAGTPCKTIAHALSVAADGDTVQIGIGTYSTGDYPMTVPNGVSLQGAGRDLSVITPATDYVGSPSYLLDVPNHTGPTNLAGFAVKNAPMHGMHVQVPANGAVTVSHAISDLAVSSAESAGMVVDGGGAETTLNFTIDGAQFHDNGGNGLTFDFYDGPLDLTLTGNTFSDNKVHGADLYVDGTGDHAYGLTPPQSVTLSGNHFLNNSSYGLLLTLSDSVHADAVIDGNTFTGNGARQLYFYMSTYDAVYLEITHNTVTDGKSDGIYLSGYADNLLWGSINHNTVTGNTGIGIVVYEYSDTQNWDLEIRGNLIDDNDEGGLALTNYSDYSALEVDVVDNTITHNGDWGIFIEMNYVGVHDANIRSNTISGNSGNGILVENYGGPIDFTFDGNVITSNGGDGFGFTDTSYSGVHVTFRHNTIFDNASSYANTGHYDINWTHSYYDALALENWFGTTDRNDIDDHINDVHDNNSYGEVIYTALDPTLAFTLPAARGPQAGNITVAIVAEEGTFFVPSAGINELVVTFDGTEAEVLSVSADHGIVFVKLPPHGAGLVDVTVTNPGGQTGTLSDGFEYITAAETFADDDGDGVEDSVDNCLGLANLDQTDTDADGLGDACDDDDDGDGVLDADDNCPFQANAGQSDLDEDDIGDACDPDADGDDVADADDNCLGIANTNQDDMDSDDIGDACDSDADGDGEPDLEQGCGCATTPAPVTRAFAVLLLGLLGLRRRRAS
ncbi:MAG: right-handed parallel beta-helix repeat-containing protein [Deltaproteobacteria bacterium]|nr:right-handed parallel beta-helix repeat-containing protein [Deltaproteobacteria bacterium]